MTTSTLTATPAHARGSGAPDLILAEHLAPPSRTRAPHPRECGLAISIPGVDAADNEALVTAIVRLTNVAFVESEAGIWNEGYNRTTAQEVASLLRNQQLALGYLSVENPSSDSYFNSLGQQFVACACVKRQSATNGSVSMLALDKQYRGLGMGRHMILFAEQHCRELGCSIMVLDLLVPTSFEHPVKSMLQAWYLRLGYEIVRFADFVGQYPEFGSLLAGPVDFKVFEKKLC